VAPGWEDGLSRLQNFAARTGSTRLSRRYVEEDGYRLGAWVVEQRAANRARRLPAERAARLATLPGWDWKSRYEAAWDEA